MARTKGERTKAAIVDAALSLVAERGFEATTMRAIAERAGVSLGNAYYYFATKDHLVQGFYDSLERSHAAILPERLAEAGTALDARLVAHLMAWVEVASPYKPFAASLFRNAADPASPLSPFSAESAPSRGVAIGLMRDVIDGSHAEPPEAVRNELPRILWLFHMGVVLFWVHDRSHGAAATEILVRRTVPLVCRAIDLAALPELAATITDLTGLMSDLDTLLGGVSDSPPDSEAGS